MRKINLNTLLLFLIVATIPLLFGAVQPLVQGIYTFLILCTSGIWLVLNYQTLNIQRFSFQFLLILILLGYVILTAVNMPLEFIELISPVRAKTLLNALQTDLLPNINTSVSYFAPATLMYAVYFLSLVLFFYFSSAFLRLDENKTIILWIITLIGTAEAVYGIVQATVPLAGVLWIPPEVLSEKIPSGTFTNHNHFAAFLNICWPVSFVLGLSMTGLLFERVEVLKIKKKKITLSDRIKLLVHRAVIPYFCTIIMISAVLLSGSIAGISVMIFIILLCRIIIPFPRKTKIFFSALLYLGVLLFGIMLSMQGIVDVLLNTVPTIALAKWSMWSESLAMLREHLFSGIGLGSYPLMAPLYANDLTELKQMTHARNEYIELAIELGLPATILFILWMLFGFISFGKRIALMPRKISKMTKDEILIIGVFFSLLGVLAHAFVETIWHTPAITLYTVLILAVLYTLTTREKMEKDFIPERIMPEKKAPKFIPYSGRKRRYRG